MRTRIEQTGHREVTLTTKETVRTFWIPSTTTGEAYIREGSQHSADDRQVCDQLYGTGNTLRATPDTLLSTIRKEWKRRVAAEKRDNAKIF